MKKYQIIYADPPWHFKVYSDKGHNDRYRGCPYPVMGKGDIERLPIKDLTDRNCILFLWATYPNLLEAFSVITAWGFIFKTVGFTWVKQNPLGNGYHFGLGYWTRANPEICLLATRGNPKRVDCNVANLIISPRRKHSQKPNEVRNRIVQLMGDIPRIELFAREKTEGWDVWGNEVESDISLEEKL
jgi:N6-adenosine-specific RNA methylase IME4